MAALLACLCLPPASFAQEKKPISVGEPPADSSPAAELATFKVLDGFQVNLFADETDGIPNPIAIRWDERGRLWVLQTSVYPQPKPDENPDDKIIILEDTDHDGRADKRTTFAGGLCQPMGMELAPVETRNSKLETRKDEARGGPKETTNGVRISNFELSPHSVYVGEGEKLWLFHDDDGDDKVDRREVVFSGFGTGDTHQCINSFVWSPDGALVMHQGLHCYSKVVTPHGTRTLYGAGFWHYRPRSGKLDAYPTGMPLNPWGTAFTNEGQPIMIAGAAGMYWARPMEVSTSDTDVGDNSSAKDRQVHAIPHFLLERFQLPYGGQCIKTEGLTKFCGIDLVGNTHWPESMQGEIVVGGFFNNKVFRFKLRDDPEFASGIEALEQPALIESDSVAFRPIDIRFGPEGACYIADWYDPIIGHYQASFRHPNRDKAHGRIWRVVAKGRAFQENGTDLDLLQLIRREKGDASVRDSAAQALYWRTKLWSRWTAYQAQRLLWSQPRRDGLRAAVADNDYPKEWTKGQRLAADVKLTGAMLDTFAAFDKPFASAAEETVISLGAPEYLRVKSARHIGLFADRFDEPLKESLVAGWAQGAAKDKQFMNAAEESLNHVLSLLKTAVADPSPRVRLEAVVAAAKVQSPEAIKVALKVLDKPMDSYIERALWLAVQATKRHWTPFAHVGVEPSGDLTNGSSPRQPTGSPSNASITPPANASKSPKGSTPTDPTTAFRTFLADMPATHIAFLIKREGSAALRDLASALLKATDLPATVREGLTRALAKEDKPVVALTKDELALAALMKQDPARAGQFVARTVDSIKDLAAMKALLAPVLPVEAAAKALTQSLKTKPCSPDAAKLILRVLTSTGRNEPELMAALGQSTAVPAYDPAWVNTLAAEVKVGGNAAKGKEVFASTLTNCVACHSIAKKGGTIGPELDALGRGVPVELVIEAVTWPNRQIKEGYIATNIVTKDGRRLMGYKVSDANGELQLRDFLGGGVNKFAASEIASRQDAGSLMPEGLVAMMTREELRDLIAFLMTLGK